MEQAKLIATLVRLVRDVDQAEELAQDAMVVALERWPLEGIPQNPGAWLTTTAKNRALDQLRKKKLVVRKHEQLGHEPTLPPLDLDAAIDNNVGDDLLRLMFITCHLVLPTDARVALTLKLLGGLSVPEIARAFLASEPTVAQRIVRAKRTLAEKRVPFETPRGNELEQRVDSVLEVIYLIFNEGYAATSGDDWMRPALCDDALRLGRTVAALSPRHAEAHGLVALMEIQASRTPARTRPDGQPILLLEQNRALWDHVLIQHGLAALRRAQSLEHPGPYTLQAAIAACHARAPTAAQTDWQLIARLYDALGTVAPSPVVELNRAVAVAMAQGPAAGLAIVEKLQDEPALAKYHLLFSVRGDFLAKLQRFDEAEAAFVQAANLTANLQERTLLLERAQACGRGQAPQR